MSEYQVTVKPKTSRYNKALGFASVGVMSVATVSANAAEALDMTEASSYLVLAIAAIGALGAAKIAPAALTWVWSIVTGMAKRG